MNGLILSFQLAVLAFIVLSFLILISVPVVFASTNGWSENKNYIIFSLTAWIILVCIIGFLNSFVI